MALVLADAQQEYFADVVKEYPLIAGVEADASLVPLARDADCVLDQRIVGQWRLVSDRPQPFTRTF